MAYYGYIRVSTKGQVPGTSLAEQEQQIKERYPTAIIVKEAASGAHERQVFDNLCKSLQAGDTLVVCKMDRFCRSAKEGLQYVDLLRDKGVAVHILNMGLLDNSPITINRSLQLTDDCGRCRHKACQFCRLTGA